VGWTYTTLRSAGSDRWCEFRVVVYAATMKLVRDGLVAAKALVVFFFVSVCLTDLHVGLLMLKS
jgi:hypothetical protein